MVERVSRRLATVSGWRFAAAVALLGALAGCSGGSPPETAPDTGRSAGPEAAPAVQGEGAQPEPGAAEPAAQEPGAAEPAADRPQTIGDLFSESGLRTSEAQQGPRTLGDLLEDAATVEQGPGFELPSDPAAPPPTGAMPPAVDSLEVVDRVVAIVGDTAILMSEVREKVFQLRAQGMEIPTDPAGQDSLAYATLEGMVEELMIVKQAEFAGITVTEDELDDEVDRRFEAIRSRFGSDEEMLERVEASGQNMFQFRRMIRSQARKDLIGQRYVGSQMGAMFSARVTEQEIVDEFNARAAGATRPATLDMVQVTIDPKPSEAARDSALKQARAARDEIHEGEEFEVVARRYSDDAGTRAEGGDLGWVRRSEVVPAFGDAAWSVRTGVAIGPVESRFGFHIIKVENVRGGERHVRHVLVQPDIDLEQVEKARELAAAVADSIGDGADPMVMAQRYGTDPEDARVDDVRVDRIAGALGNSFAEALRGAQTGDVVGPIETSGNTGSPSFVVIKVVRYRPEGSYELDEVRDQIRDQIQQRKQYEALVARLKEEVYVRMLI